MGRKRSMGRVKERLLLGQLHGEFDAVYVAEDSPAQGQRIDGYILSMEV